LNQNTLPWLKPPVTGAVVVEVRIDESGNVISANAISGHPLLKDSAVSAALQWKFPPTTLSGIAVKVIGALTSNFALAAGSGDDSIAAQEKEVRNHPDSTQAYFKLALAYHREDRFTDAIQALKDAVRLDPGFGLAYFTLGDYLLGTGQNAEALDALKEAIRIDPHHAEAYDYLGLALVNIGRYEEAIASFKQSIANDPSAPGGYRSMGVAYELMKRYQEAVEPFKQAIKREPDNGSPILYYDYVNLAAAYEKLDRLTDEINTLKQAIAFRPRIAQAHFELGMAYLKTGDKKSATDQYNMVKSLDPEMGRELKQGIDKLRED
jgi:tetratricopeptide (TPR) repeat protein